MRSTPSKPFTVIRGSARLVLGSIVVYGCVAASNAATGGAGAGDDAGTGGPVPDAHAEPAQDGTRLKARYFVGADGSKQFKAWFDSERKEECTFMDLGDGTARCAPRSTGAGTIWYLEASCTNPVIETTSACTGGYVVDSTSAAKDCDAPKSTLYKVGASKVVAPTAQFGDPTYRKEGGVCKTFGFFTNARTYFAITLVDPKELVSAEVK